MLKKHPQAAPPTLPTGPVPPPATLSESVVWKGVNSFPKGSAAGPSGLRPSHLREAVRCPAPDNANQLLSSLTRFANLLAAGQAPPTITPLLSGATLLACRKKNGGHRPIAVGEVLRRLVSKCLAIQTRPAILSILSPLQLGVGVRGGCEAIVHAVSKLLASAPADRCRTLLLDFSNAFNCVNREAMFAEFRRHLPGLSSWMESCYSCQPILYLGNSTIRSCCGVQQGDPLGPLGFAMTLHPIVERIKSEVPSLAMNAWYLDDGALVGCDGDLAAALRIIEEDGPPVGLHLNRGKSLLYIPQQCESSNTVLPPEIPVTQSGFTLLGCPIGPPSYCEEMLQARVYKVRESLAALHDLGDSQIETALLRSCLALPKLSYVLRTCPPDHIQRAARNFDAALREALESILGGPMTEWSWQKASLPSSRGGINLRQASLHAPAAFVASSYSSSELVGQLLNQPPGPSSLLASAIPALSASASRPNWQTLDDIDIPIVQRHLSSAIDEAVHQQLLSSTQSTRARALALSTSLPHAGDWLNGIPSATLGLHLQDQSFRCCLRYWLGVPLHSSPYSCPECHSTADKFGDHQVGCGGNGDRIVRHNAIRDVLFSAAQSAALGPVREASSMISNSQSRPADVLLPTWHHGRPAALDVHVISPLQDATLHEAATTPGHALQVGTQRKLNSHLSACRSAGMDFIPMVTETLGGLSDDFIHMVRALGKSIAQRANPRDSTISTSQLFHRIAVTLWRGNAALWLNRQPHLPPSVDGII